MIVGQARIELKGLTKFRDVVRDGKGQAIERIMTKWSARTRGYLLKRFDLFSKGGGNWAPLSPATIKRKSKKGGKTAILVDTGLMKNSLNPNLGPASSSTKVGRWHITVGFGGTSTYPSGASVADIATFHNFGTSTLPQRKIIVTPDQMTLNLMAKDAEFELKKLQKELVNG